jgi:lipid-binding SYLF domain-containing protein
MKLHNPLPENLDLTCKKVSLLMMKGNFHSGTFHQRSQSARSFINPSICVKTRLRVSFSMIQRIAIITIVKAGVLWSGRAGTGLVVARLADGSWSPPSAICAGGVGMYS